MRRACRKIWRSVPCTSRKSLRTDSRKDMEEILRAKLSTIKEEPELCEENLTSPRHKRKAKKQGKKVQAKGIASKGNFAGLCMNWLNVIDYWWKQDNYQPYNNVERQEVIIENIIQIGFKCCDSVNLAITVSCLSV
ncbi:hypothetical protein CR513_44812, partial [Mucuna pruriens]